MTEVNKISIDLSFEGGKSYTDIEVEHQPTDVLMEFKSPKSHVVITKTTKNSAPAYQISGNVGEHTINPVIDMNPFRLIERNVPDIRIAEYLKSSLASAINVTPK